MPIPYSEIAHYLLINSHRYVTSWVPGGRITGAEYCVCNPRRNDKRPTSFKINLRTGEWADFATGDKGRDLISLYAYLNNLKNSEAARELSLTHGR
jgi:hypothetical protein